MCIRDRERAAHPPEGLAALFPQGQGLIEAPSILRQSPRRRVEGWPAKSALIPCGGRRAGSGIMRSMPDIITEQQQDAYFSSKLTFEGRQKLRAIVKKVHSHHDPTELLTDLEAFAGSGSAEFDLLRL